MTEAEHKEVYDRVTTLIDTNPEDLLPQHQYLLLETYFKELDEGTTHERQVWIKSIESALFTACLQKEKEARSQTSNSRQYQSGSAMAHCSQMGKGCEYKHPTASICCSVGGG